MSPMPPKVIAKEDSLWAKSLSGQSKDPRPKRCPNTWKRDESKEIMVFTKVEEKDVRHKKYDGHYMKQWVRISKVTLTSPILGKRSTCRAYFNKTSSIKDDVNDEVPNGTLRSLIPFDGGLK
jgi:hypothetical protein